MKGISASLIKRITGDKSIMDRLSSMSNGPQMIMEISCLCQQMGHDVPKDVIQNFLAGGVGLEMSDHDLEQVVGGKNDQYVYKGDDGNDSMIGGTGVDSMHGGDGNDTMKGWFGDDTIDGGKGNDVIHGDSGSDRLYGGSGDDLMDGGGKDDTLKGESGDDTMYGGHGDDYMEGGSGDDSMNAGWGDDTLKGGSGDDYLDGSAGNDTLEGGHGNDTLEGGEGNDLLTGGKGSDTFVFGENDGHSTITDFNFREDSLQFLGANSPDDLTVTSKDGNTYISYGNSTAMLEGIILTPEQVWECTNR